MIEAWYVNCVVLRTEAIVVAMRSKAVFIGLLGETYKLRIKGDGGVAMEESLRMKNEGVREVEAESGEPWKADAEAWVVQYRTPT